MSYQKLYITTSFFIKFNFIVTAIISAITENWIMCFFSLLALILSFLPILIEKRFDIDIPIELELIILIFIYASIFLGEAHNYYYKYHWWDLMLHTLSAIVLGLLGFIFVYALNKDMNVSLKLNPFFISLFSFSFALSVGTLWEIFEFFMDYFLGFNMQKSGLVDTMTDLMVDAIGALVISFLGYYYSKKIDKSILKKLYQKFKKE